MILNIYHSVVLSLHAALYTDRQAKVFYPDDGVGPLHGEVILGVQVVVAVRAHAVDLVPHAQLQEAV